MDGANNEEAYVSTLSEFFILSQAERLISLHSYSGFSHIASIIGGILMHVNYSDPHLQILEILLLKIKM